MRHLSTLALIVGFVIPATTVAYADTKRVMECTAYCPCGRCNSYSRGHWFFLKLDYWNRTFNAGPDKGRPYTGKTAGGHKLKTPRKGIPFLLPRRLGTIAADRRYYPFGTVMYVPGWGWGVVDDVGGDIKGPNRLDLFFRTHAQCNNWGRRRVTVTIKD